MHSPDIDSGWRKQNIPAQVEYFDPDTVYHSGTVFLYDDWLSRSNQSMLQTQLDQGYRIIYDNKGENQRPNDPLINVCAKYPGQVLWLASGIQHKMPNGIKFVDVPVWDWLVSQFNFAPQRNYVPAPTYLNRFLMLLRVQRTARDDLFAQVQPLLSNALYSYRSRGIHHLPNDMPDEDLASQQFLNPEWYNNTCVSLVSETLVSEKLVGSVPVALSEKTYKPLAMCHPYIFWAQPYSLQFLKKYGFESFPELWDESYDLEENYLTRLCMVIKNLKDFDVDDIKSTIVQEKLKYNQQRFWDTTVTKKLTQTDVIDPIMEFVNA
jgi:hypothetical protein